ncbi:MAG: twin transmembrane helix small protein [Legionellaceae bacterium]|nr:twin transmembrane helix small protein [Legionellaceae bacterium]
MIKTVIVLLMLIIVLALASSLIFLVKDEGKTKRTMIGLSWRIGLSLMLFFLLFLAFSLGWLQPHGL